jgi:hypothetical protein
MEFLAGITLGVLLWWVLFFGALIIAAGGETAVGGFFVLLAGAVTAWIFLGVVPWSIFAGLSTAQLVLLPVGYLIAGLAWSFFRWDRYIAKQSKWIKRNSKGPVDESFIPVISENKDRYASWIFLWPASMFVWVFDDLL